MCAEIGFKTKNSKLVEKYLSLGKSIEPNNPAVLFGSGKEQSEFKNDENAAL